MAADSHTFTNPFQAEAEAVVAAQQARRDQARTGGVSWSGLTSPAPEVEDVEVVRLRIVAGHDSAVAWAKTPRGRFYRAIQQLREIGYTDEAERLEGHYRRSLADDREPLNVPAVGAALAILNPLAGQDARDARGALAELLMSDQRRAA